MNQIVANGAATPLVLVSLSIAGTAGIAACSSGSPGASVANAADAAADAGNAVIVIPVAMQSDSDAADAPLTPEDANAELGDDGGDHGPALEASDASSGTPGSAGPDSGVVPEAASLVPLTCPTGQSVCADRCVDLSTDATNCSQCGAACAVTVPNASPTCAGGVCSFACNSGYHACGASCASDSSFDSCGSACIACPGAPVANATEACAASGSSYACQWSCNAGYTLCSGVCVDESSDPANCGACGSSCAPGACSSGACQAWVLANTPQPAAIATDGTSVYWADETGSPGMFQTPSTTVASAAGAAAPTPLGTFPPGAVHGLVLAGSNVFCATTSTQGSYDDVYAATEGSAMSIQGVASLPDPPGGIAYSTEQIYLNVTNGTTVSLWSCNVPGIEANDDPCGTIATYSGSKVGPIAADDNGIFWIDPSNALVSHYLFANASVSSVAVSQSGARSIALDANNVYWDTSANGGTISATSKQSPGTPVTLASGVGTVTALVSDGTNVYFASEGTEIVAVPVGGGPVATLYTPPSGVDVTITALAYAAGTLYWADSGQNEILGQRLP
jgi:hypothetical protein